MGAINPGQSLKILSPQYFRKKNIFKKSTYLAIILRLNTLKKQQQNNAILLYFIEIL